MPHLLAVSAQDIDRQLKDIATVTGARKASVAARSRWHIAGMHAFMQTQVGEGEEAGAGTPGDDNSRCTSTMVLPMRQPSEGDEQNKAVLKRLWKMFEPVALLSFMQEGHLVHHQSALAQSAKRFIDWEDATRLSKVRACGAGAGDLGARWQWRVAWEGVAWGGVA